MANMNLEAVLTLRDNASATLKKLSKQAAAAAKSFDKLEDEVEDTGKASKKAGESQKKLGKETKKAGDEAVRSAEKFKESSSKLDDFQVSANTFAKAGLVAAGVGMVALAKGAIDAVAELETFEVQLEVLLKDSKLAKERLEELFKIGSTTPFELGALVQADVIIQSFGADANELRFGIMDLAGAMNKELPEAALAVAKSFSVGKAGSDGLRESFALLYTDVLARAKEMGDPSDVKIWQRAMIDALQAVDGVVAGGTEKLAATFRGKLSNMADAWFKLKVSIGKGGLFEYVSTGMKVMLEDIDAAEGGINRLGSAISDDLITGMEALIRVGAVMVQTLLALASGIEFILAGFQGLLTILDAVTVGIAKVNLAFYKMMDAGLSTEATRKNIARLTEEMREARKAAIASGEAMMSALDRIDRMGRMMMDLGSVGEKLDEIRKKTDALRASAAKKIRIEVETKTTTTGGGGQKSMGELIDIMSGQSGAAPKKTTTTGGGGGGGGTGTSPAVKEFERLQKAIEALVPKAALDNIQKSGELWSAAMDAQAKFGDKSKHDFDALLAQIETVGVELKQQQREAGEAVASEAMFELVREMNEVAPAARRAALELSGTWRESDSLAIQIDKAETELSTFRERMALVGVTSDDVAGSLGAMTGRIDAMNRARSAALDVEHAELEESMGLIQRLAHEWKEMLGTMTFSLKSGVMSAGADLASAGINLGGKILSGVTSVASGGLGGAVGAMGPVGAGVQALSGIGQMGYTKQEEYVDPKTGEKKTREVEVSAAEAIGEQMEEFLNGFIVAIVEVLPVLLSEVIPEFIIEGVPALITGLLEAMPKIGMALFVNLPIALVKGLGQWWKDAWQAVEAFFSDVGGLFGKDAGKEWGKVGAGAAAGAAIGSVVPGIGTAIGAGVGALAGAVFHSGGYADRTGPALLMQGERVVPPTGADSGTARANGLAAFMGGGSNVTINTSVVDPDSINRLGVMLDEQFGSYGRNTLPVMG